MKAKWPWVLVGLFCLVAGVALYLWPSPMVTDPDPGMRFLSDAWDFQLAVEKAAGQNGGRIVDLDSRASDYGQQLSSIRKSIDEEHYISLSRLATSKDRYRVNPQVLGKRLQALKSDQLLILIESRDHPRMKGLLSDGSPVSTPVK